MTIRHDRRLGAVTLLVITLAACHSNPPTGPHAGSLAGIVSSTLTGGLAGISVILTPANESPLPPVKTDSTGAFTIEHVPPGAGTIAIAGVPIGCTPPPTSYSGVQAGMTTTVNVTVPCVKATGTIRGIITNSLGGSMVEATVTVTPDTAAPLPSVLVSDTGTYVVSAVAIGSGKVTVATLPAGCTIPTAVTYSTLGFGDTLTVNFAVTCTFVDQIAFYSLSVGNIATMNSDGSGVTRVTSDTAETRTPAWAPDGQRLAFARSTPAGIQLMTINADGTNERALTDGSTTDQDPAWSPTGRLIAYSSIGAQSGIQVWVINPDGTHPTQLTNAWIAAGPSWSPDGTKIAYAAGYGSNLQHVWVMNADGSNPTQLTSEAGGDDFVAWSPDGSKIAFASGRDNVCYACGQIYIMNADGSSPTRLTQTTDDEIRPEWSPDGTKIIYEDYTTDQLFVMNADGTNPTTIAAGVDPAWKYRPTPVLSASRAHAIPKARKMAHGR
jgi:Tol biopolymer transport system component